MLVDKCIFLDLLVLTGLLGAIVGLEMALFVGGRLGEAWGHHGLRRGLVGGPAG